MELAQARFPCEWVYGAGWCPNSHGLELPRSNLDIAEINFAVRTYYFLPRSIYSNPHIPCDAKNFLASQNRRATQRKPKWVGISELTAGNPGADPTSKALASIFKIWHCLANKAAYQGERVAHGDQLALSRSTLPFSWPPTDSNPSTDQKKV